MFPIHLIPWKTLPSHQLLSPGESGDQTLGLWRWSLVWHNPHSTCSKNQAGIISHELHNNYEWHEINELQLMADIPSACGTSAEVVSWFLSLNILSEVLCAPSHQPTALSQAGVFCLRLCKQDWAFWPQKLRYFWPHSSLRAICQETNIVC